MNPDLRKRATRCRATLGRIMDILDLVADEAPRVLANAQAWEGTLRAASLQPGGRGGQAVDGEPAPPHGDPTGDQAGQVPAIALLAPQLLVDLDQLEKAVAALAHDALRLDITRRRCVISIPDGDTYQEVVELNRRDGLCPTCNQVTCTGRGDDRLRLVTVDQGATKLMCDACRKAWDRRPVDDLDQRIDYRTFARGRRRRTA